MASLDKVLYTARAHTTGGMGRMALLAQHGRAHLEHPRNYTAMGIMAIGAILRHRVVLAHKGTALLGVAGVARVVGTVTLGQLGTSRTMDVMAVSAAHLAFWHWVARGFIHLGALLFVAGVAHLGLCDFLQHLVTWGMHLMATITCNIRRLVLTAQPKRAFGIRIMARLTHTAALGSRNG